MQNWRKLNGRASSPELLECVGICFAICKLFIRDLDSRIVPLDSVSFLDHPGDFFT